jgi:uncharacterized protein (DUF1499 family)
MNDKHLWPRHAWLGWVSWLVLVAGAGVAAVALAAPAGVWLGLWRFVTGFQILFNYAAPYAAWIAGIGAAVTVALFAAASVLKTGNAARVGGVALAGTLAAAVAWYVPSSYRPGENDNIPPIHDISTDTADPPTYVAVLPLRADAPNTVEYGASPNMTPEQLAEMTRSAYPDLVTVTLAVPPDAAFERAMAAVDALGWDLVASAPDEGRIEATDTTFWFRFKDDVVIRIRPAPGGSTVDARSLSRVGGGDAGTNARRLRAFFAEL